MKASDISNKLIGKKIRFNKNVVIFTGETKTYTLEGEIIGVTKEDDFIDITIVRECGLPFKSSVEHIGINFYNDPNYDTLSSAELID